MYIFKYIKDLIFYFYYIFLILIFVGTINFIYFEEILYMLLKPLNNILKNYHLNNDFEKNYLIFTNLTEVLIIYIKVYITLTFIIIIPCSFFQLYSFLINGLYYYEKKKLSYIFLLLILIFLINNLITYFIFIPLTYYFFLSFEHISDNNLFNIYFEGKIYDYLILFFNFFVNFTLCLFLPFFIYFLNYLNIININFLTKNRKIFYFLFLILIFIFSPPDIFLFIFLIFFYLFFYEFSLYILCIIKHCYKL
jgi:sec-independent protein translocase protein TatC